VVITSVTRDDLPDGGAGHFARVTEAVRRRLPKSTIEILIPDFQGNEQALATALAGGCDILNHNVETAPRLYPTVRPQADYLRSLGVLDAARRIGAQRQADNSGKGLYTKSGLMLGLGETRDELLEVFADLRAVECDILTIGQYLAPSPQHHPVVRFVPPAEFDEIREQALAWSLGMAWPREIETVNILRASLAAMCRAVASLKTAPEFLIVDGPHPVPLDMPQQPMVRADALVPAVSAASILAKCYRDRLMTFLDRRYPGYEFARHKGYPTARHLLALERLGPCLMHRQPFQGVRIQGRSRQEQLCLPGI